MGLVGWLLQRPVRALVLLLVGAMALGLELSSFFNGPWLCSADWFVGDPADCSVKAFVGVAVGCGQPGRIAGTGELAIQLADHGDPVQPGGGVDGWVPSEKWPVQRCLGGCGLQRVEHCVHSSAWFGRCGTDPSSAGLRAI